MRDLIFALLVVGLLPTCFRRPFIGLVVFSWLAYMRGQDMTWGFARNERWSLYVALVTVAGHFTGGRKAWFQRELRCYLMILLVIIVGIGVPFSRNPDAYQFSRYTEFVKIIGVALFTTAVVQTREQLRVLVWVVALSFGFHGVKSGIWGIQTLGQHQILRGPGGMLADNNDFALAMAMSIPLLLQIANSEKREVLRRAFMLMVPLTMITVVLTHSRGGFLSMSTAMAVLVWRSRNRVAGIALMLLVIAAGYMLAPSSYKERLSTLRTYEEDGSAMGRIHSWAVATRMATDNPLVGVGFGKFRENYLRYEPNPTPRQLSGEDIIVAHNSYLQIWAECGTPAFAIYLVLIGATFASLWKVRRMARDRYFASWIINYANMFEASLLCFVVGSVFINRAHFDLLYHYVAIVLAFSSIAQREMLAGEELPLRAGQRGELRLARATGFGLRPATRGFRNTPLGQGSA
jgi:putative inorganic carbon (HCO3(-)) transporter